MDSAGIITTIAGNGVIGYTGDGGLATAAELEPDAIAIDTVGNLFIADFSAGRVRMVNTAGIINTVAGNSTGSSADSINPLMAHLCFPSGVAVNNVGIYIGEVCNNRVRLVTMHPLDVNNTTGILYEVDIFPNPCYQDFIMQVNSAMEEPVDVAVSDLMSREVYRTQTFSKRSVEISVAWPSGVYILSATAEHWRINRKFVVQ